MTAAILDDLLARKTVAGRPPELADDLVWVRARRDGVRIPIRGCRSSDD